MGLLRIQIFNLILKKALETYKRWRPYHLTSERRVSMILAPYI